MNRPIPPLPDLEISGTTPTRTDQNTVDTALKIIYDLRPDLFLIFFEKEEKREDLGEYGDEFYRLVRQEVWKHVKKPPSTLLASISILLEARKRARIMYGNSMPPSI